MSTPQDPNQPNPLASGQEGVPDAGTQNQQAAQPGQQFPPEQYPQSGQYPQGQSLPPNQYPAPGNQNAAPYQNQGAPPQYPTGQQANGQQATPPQGAPGYPQQPGQNQYQAPPPGAAMAPPAQQYPALAGAVPVSAGKQILSWLIDGALFFLITLPFNIYLFSAFDNFSSVAGQYSGYTADMLTDSQTQELAQASSPFLGASSLLLVVTLVLHFIWWWLIATKGKTPGMHWMGQRLVSKETGKPVGWGKGFLRGFVVVVTANLTMGVAGLLFWISPLFDSSSGWNQGWLDKMIQAVYIDTTNGRDTGAGA